jgi:hypothetical protein
MPQRLSRRAAQGMQKRMTRSAFALDEELTNKEKKLRDRSLLSQSALILELWMVLALLIAAIKKNICAQAIMHNLYACLFLRMLSHNQAEYKYLHISSERR